jgi:hypothetical protein
MPEAQASPLITQNSRKGRVVRKAGFLDRNENNRVELDDGAELNVAPGSLKVHADGSFLLDDSLLDERALEARAERVSEAAPRLSAPSNNSHARNRWWTRCQTKRASRSRSPIRCSLRVSMWRRSRVKRILDAPAQVRQEGDVTIIPVIEEVITGQKRLLLREGIRITRRRTELRELRRMVIDTAEARTYGRENRNRRVEAHHVATDVLAPA